MAEFPEEKDTHLFAAWSGEQCVPDRVPSGEDSVCELCFEHGTLAELQDVQRRFRRAIARLTVEKEYLHYSLIAAETTAEWLKEEYKFVGCAAEQIRLKIEEHQRKQAQHASTILQLQEELRSLQRVLAKTREKPSCGEEELAPRAAGKDNTASPLRDLGGEHARLKDDNQSLEHRAGDLGKYSGSLREWYGREGMVSSQGDKLTADNKRLPAEPGEMETEFHGCQTSAAKRDELSEEGEQLELSSEQRESHSGIAKPEELNREEQDEEEEKDLKHEREDAALWLRSLDGLLGAVCPP
ncbi:hypothetical protein HPB50_008474 [Hyalomma asiaticum]|uniref:Uncharacterized protein n=1 Tax=Hyalomma asiaticum TaxID=266040 RepID=A0ACB7TJ96_HYAAI|nr:hypothetical protein HPB50_008474 [Hyalomma asiaticum]